MLECEYVTVTVWTIGARTNQLTMSSDADQSVSVTMSLMADDKDDISKNARVEVSSIDSAVSQRWTSPSTAATTTNLHDNEHDDCIENTSVDELRGIYQHGSIQRSYICPTVPPLYGRLAGTEFDVSYDYNYSPQYSSRYTSFQGPSPSSYVDAVTPYAAPYSPSGLTAYPFNLARPYAAGAAYNGYVPHHQTPPSAALLTSERSAPSYRFTQSSTSLLQSRTLIIDSLSMCLVFCRRWRSWISTSSCLSGVHFWSDLVSRYWTCKPLSSSVPFYGRPL